MLKPLVMTFFLEIESFAVSAALLPSLHAEYKMEKVVSKGKHIITRLRLNSMKHWVSVSRKKFSAIS